MQYFIVWHRMLFPGDSQWNPIEVVVKPFQQTRQPEEFNVGVFSSASFMGMIFVLIPVSLAADMVYDREVSTTTKIRY